MAGNAREAHLSALRLPDLLTYPQSPNAPRIRCKACRKDFSITSGTLFASHKLSLRSYLVSIAIFCNEVKGKNALASSRDLGVQYKTAFVLAHKLREGMASELKGHRLGGVGTTVEIDGAYFGGHVKPENKKEDRKDRRLAENQNGKRQCVVVIRQRDGRTLPQAFKSEAEALSFIRQPVAKGTAAGRWPTRDDRWEIAPLMNCLRIAALLLCLPTAVLAQANPVFSDTGPDAAGYGAAQGYPIGGRTPPTQPQMVGSYSHYDRIWPFHRVAKAEAPSPLQRAPQEIAPTYLFRGRTNTLADYLAHNPVTGLLIARDDTILFEHYQYGRTDQDRLLSQSMAKTIVAMLIGIAIDEGRIHSVDDTAQTYVPELVGSAFGLTSLRALLHMAAGLAFRENYDDPTADNFKLGRALFGQSGFDPAQAVAMFNTHVAPPDTHFTYGGVQTEVLGLVLTHAVGMSPAAYLQSRIWQPMGAEADAIWTVDHTGQEVAYCCFNAVLRDWARLGLLLAHDGMTNGRQLIPRQWLLDATTEPADSPFSPHHATGYMGYGYQTWLFPGPRRQFAFLGIHGQSIYVDPAARLTMVQTAVNVPATGTRTEAIALWQALVAAYGK